MMAEWNFQHGRIATEKQKGRQGRSTLRWGIFHLPRRGAKLFLTILVSGILFGKEGSTDLKVNKRGVLLCFLTSKKL